MAVEKLRQVFMVADDMDAAVEFYQGVLGLELQFRDGDNWAQFSAGDVSFAIASSSEGQGAPVGVPVPVFAVDDLQAHAGAAREAGATVGEVRDMGDHGTIVLVTDPSGGRFSLFQR